ncbi:MAG: serine/threonine protein kinase, partial [Candidatus Eisenbacteria bacterium]|nr:serine/threonine protein kinase [Candidatus Eisenbacteria bacterium]
MGELATPKTISHFRLLEHLGAGGMGTVYKAHDTRLDRLVAVKRISPETQDPHATDRLMLEARAAAALNHPNIAVIYEVDQEEDEAFIAMEFVEGQTLYNRVRAETVDWEIGLQWLIESADALIEAHAKGVIHRDIKTKNLMVTQRGSIKILDFGLAKVAGFTQESSQMTQSGSLVGTIDYLAPEILRGGEASNQSDLFSLGVVAYEIFAGKLPFRGRTPVMVMMAILEETPKPLSDLAPELPATV